eukprot:Sspe_Gene.36476::Locus_17623_Transcript_1_1_Confidence_1.000_Length_1301::g.36476::m.36476
MYNSMMNSGMYGSGYGMGLGMGGMGMGSMGMMNRPMGTYHNTGGINLNNPSSQQQQPNAPAGENHNSGLTKAQLYMSGVQELMQALLHLIEWVAQTGIMGLTCYCTYTQVKQMMVSDVPPQPGMGGGPVSVPKATPTPAAPSPAKASFGRGFRENLLTALFVAVAYSMLSRFKKRVDEWWKGTIQGEYPRAAIGAHPAVEEDIMSDVEDFDEALETQEQRGSITSVTSMEPSKEVRLQCLQNACRRMAPRGHRMTRLDMVEVLRADHEVQQVFRLPTMITPDSSECHGFEAMFQHMDINDPRELTWEEFEAELTNTLPSTDCIAVALFPYTASRDDEITFDQNDRLVVHSQVGKWWRASLVSRPDAVGYIPSNFVEFINKNKI